MYMVRCADGRLYTGVTTDVQRRVAEHNGQGETSGAGAKCTRARRPVAVVYQEAHESRSAACKREWEIKQLSKTEKEALLP